MNSKPYFSVSIIDGEKKRVITAAEGETILDALERIHDIHIDASCGGKGTCGKCKVLVTSGGDPVIHDREREFLSEAELEKGYRLACLA